MKYIEIETEIFYKCTTLLYKIAIWPTKDQILQTCDYFKEGDMAGR